MSFQQIRKKSRFVFVSWWNNWAYVSFKNSLENPQELGAYQEVELFVDDASKESSCLFVYSKLSRTLGSQQEMEETNSFVIDNEDETANSTTSEEREEQGEEEEDEADEESAEPMDKVCL